MTLVDTSIWIDHLRIADLTLARLLKARTVLVHPFVVGELALGSIANRQEILQLLDDLTQPRIASMAEVRSFVERHGLSGQGIGYVDAHLLAATALTPGSAIWTRDKRLDTAAHRLGLARV